MSEPKQTCHKNHRQRMRERFIKNGFSGFADHEILEFLLFYAIPRCDTNKIAHALLDKYKTLANVFDADRASLAKTAGIGENSALFLTVIPQLLKVYDASKFSEKPTMYDTATLGQYAVAMLKGNKTEMLAMICLDSNRRVQWSGIISNGSISEISFSPRVILSAVLEHNAKNIVLVHNHPGGSLVPSIADRKATQQIAQLLHTVDVHLLDHLIVAEKQYYSFAQSGFIF